MNYELRTPNINNNEIPQISSELRMRMAKYE